MSRKDGSILWRRSFPKGVWSSKAVAVSNYFVVALGDKVQCLKQTDGNVANSVNATGRDLATKDEKVLVCTQERIDGFSAYSGFSLTVPNFVRTKLTEADWNAATGKKLGLGDRQWNRDEIHDGYVYVSERDSDGEHISIGRIQVTTGKQEKIYEEVLPPDMQRKRK